MKHTMILYITLPKINKLMKKVDLLMDGKYFYKSCEVIFEPKKEINDDYFLDLIYQSKESDSNEFIVAVSYMGNFYHHEDARVLSDGRREMFLP